MAAPKSEKYANLAATTLASAYTAADGQIIVTSADGFPADGDFRVRLGDAGDVTVTLFKATSVSGTTFTGTAEGTDSNIASGKAVTQVLTSGALDAMRINDCGTGLFADIPAAEKAGRLYYPTDTYGPYRDNGSSWDLFYHGRKCTAPPTTGWSFEGTGSSIVTSGQALMLGSTDTTTYYRPLTAPYVVTIAVAPFYNFKYSSFFSFGFRDTAAATKWLVFYIMPDTGVGWQKRSDYAGTSSVAYTSNAGAYPSVWCGVPVWLRIEDDNTNLKIFHSIDGFNWIQYDQNRSRTDYLGTPYGPGFLLGGSTKVVLLSWEQT